MAYFPFFMDIEQQEGLIVGGGRVAAQKAEKLIPFDARLTIIAPDIEDSLRENPAVDCIQREFRDSDVEGKFFVIAATDDENLNGHISRLCAALKIPVNVVDDKEKCGFLFPSIVKRGDLVAAISTGGASPRMAAQLRGFFEAGLSPRTEEILDYLAGIRKGIKDQIPDELQRRNILLEITDECLEKDRSLTEAETRAVFAKYKGK